MYKATIVWIITIIFLISCAAPIVNMPPRKFFKFTFEDGPVCIQEKQNIKIACRLLNPQMIFSYPQYFSYSVDQELESLKGDKFFIEILPTENNRIWHYVFSDPSFKKQLVACHVIMENNTEHILRMRDARLYLIPEGKEPIESLNTVDEIAGRITWLESEYEGEEGWKKKGSYFYTEEKRYIHQYPVGLSSQILYYNRDNFKLITDLGAEVLPGFTYSGLLVFPYVPDENDDLTISFFDITVKTDPAGNPLEKTRFDFHIFQEPVILYYSDVENLWLSEAMIDHLKSEIVAKKDIEPIEEVEIVTIEEILGEWDFIERIDPNANKIGVEEFGDARLIFMDDSTFTFERIFE
ncbi:MAG: hypothetical protein ACTSYF_14555, partial [Promethearchaeota archaeon]